MCGLVVYLKNSAGGLSPRLVESMTHALEHRGPDDFGMCFIGEQGPMLWRNSHNAPDLSGRGIAMGHRRLSVFDLSEAGRQPFLSANKRFAMVFNGEIYNFVELRNELAQTGVQFFTECDTEVLLYAFEKWGVDCFPRLNGCWAVAIWDNLKKELIVSRDRLGEKPLLYARLGKDWIFASELGALLTHPALNARINEEALAGFLLTGGGANAEATFFHDIKSVEPGTYLRFCDGRVTRDRYWFLARSQNVPRNDKDTIREFDELLTDAVRLRLRSDIRVGAMLSGGLDSTSVISCVASLLTSQPGETHMVGDTLQAFTACFPGLGNDETAKVEQLCRMIDVGVHKTFPQEQTNLEERMIDLAKRMEGPFFSPAIVVYDDLMKLVGSTDVPIVLDGMGSDELLGGFNWYLPLAIRDSLQGLRFREGIKEFVYTARRHPSGRLGLLRSVMRAHQFSQYGELAGDRRPTEALAAVGLKQGGAHESHLFDTALSIDLLSYNVPRWLHMGDRISMANSVVSRSPFLDFRLVEFSYSLPRRLKIRNGVTKYILRQAKREVLPATIIKQKRKIQLSGPGGYWLRGPLKDLVLSMRDGEASKLSRLMSKEALRSRVDSFLQGPSRTKTTNRMWRMISAEAFLRAYS